MSLFASGLSYSEQLGSKDNQSLTTTHTAPPIYLTTVHDPFVPLADVKSVYTNTPSRTDPVGRGRGRTTTILYLPVPDARLMKNWLSLNSEYER